MTKGCCIIKVEVLIGTIRTLDVAVTTEIIGREVSIVEAEAGIEMIVEDLRGAEERE